MRIYKIKVNGKTFEVKVMGITEVEPVEVNTVQQTVAKKEEAPVKEASPKAVSSGEGTPVPSPMQGTILDVKVKAGEAVKAGQTLVILEAMKLENEIKAPTDGIVKEVIVSKGQQVNSKDTLVILG